MPIRVDASDLISAMTSGPEMPWFLDPESGELRAVLRDDHEERPQGWIEVPALDSHEEYRIMERFAASQEDPDVREALDSALGGKGAFRRFRDTVGRWPDILSAWHDFRDGEVLEEGERWLESLDIDATIELPKPRVGAPPPPPIRKPAPPRVGLVEMLLLGAPDGKTEMLGGKVPRVFVGGDASAARKVFADVARDIHEQGGLGWRKGYIAGRNAVTVGRYDLSIDDRLVTLEVRLEPGTWERFGG
ncbi:MAG: hypothetical protein IT385_10795 [Deltaproteobacteria bacterium]|nr:hypothetical protein [Deltaproteobacteria bacterium]